MLASGVFWGQVGNSAIAAVATTAFVVILGLMAAYALSRYRFRGRGAVFALFTAGLMFPMTVAITPLYILVRNLGLINSLAGVIVPQIAFALPLTIIILSPFLSRSRRSCRGERRSNCHSARLGFFWRMVVPPAVPRW